MSRKTLLACAGLAFVAFASASPAFAQRSNGGPTDYKNPIRDGAKDGYPAYHVTICEGSTGPGSFVWKSPLPGVSQGSVVGADNLERERSPSGAKFATAGTAGGTAMHVNVSGRVVGDSMIKLTLKPADGTTTIVYLTVHVIRCDGANEGNRGVRDAAVRPRLEITPAQPQPRQFVPATPRPIVPVTTSDRDKQGGC
jgi:hypothetical protein